MQWGGGVVVGDQLPTFDAESKSAKIPNLVRGGERVTNFQLLILSLNLLKSKNTYGRDFPEKFLSFWAKSMLDEKL